MDITQENDKLNQFGSMAKGLGYDPQEVDAFMKMAAMAETTKSKREEELRKKELQDYIDRITAQKQIDQKFQTETPYNPDNDPVLQRELYLKKMEGSANPYKYLSPDTSMAPLPSTTSTQPQAEVDTSGIESLVETGSVFESDPVLGTWYSQNADKIKMQEEQMKRENEKMKMIESIKRLPQINLAEQLKKPSLNRLSLPQMGSNFDKLNITGV